MRSSRSLLPAARVPACALALAAALAAVLLAPLAGCGGTASDPTLVAQAPLARLRVPRLADPQSQVLFDGGDAVSPGGALLHWRFDFGDGTPVVDAGAPRLHHTYAAEGVFAVSLEVEDLLGRKARAATQVTVRAGAPVCLVDRDCAAGDLCREARCTTEVGSTDR